jgi:predicted DNA-binding transcriptional regulator YafY
MRRSDRLYALVEELRGRAPRPVTRARLAEALEVSPRTIERDVLALQQAGVPIWTERGRAGGYALDAGWHLPPLNLDTTEALALVTALARAETLPFAASARRAAQKVVAGLRVAEGARLEELAARVRVEPEATRSVAEPDVLAAVEQAVLERRVVRMQYLDRRGEPTTRDVEAHGLRLSPGGAFLVGWCRLRGGGRSFRLDRIGSVRLTGEVAPARDLDALVGWAGEAAVSGARPAPRRGGPPRRADDVTGSGPGFAIALARALPGVAEQEAGATTTFAAGGRPFLAVEADGMAALHLDPDTPEPFRLHLPRVPRDDVRSLVARAWRQVAPARARRAHDAALAARAPALSPEDVRGIVLALPAVTERQRSLRDGDSVQWETGRTMFVMYGRASNLLPPDVADTLMIRLCPDRAAVLAGAPDRFFVTPHYGDTREPGAVLTRLSENTTDHLDELAELIEESWRAFVPKRVLAAHTRGDQR